VQAALETSRIAEARLRSESAAAQREIEAQGEQAIISTTEAFAVERAHLKDVAATASARLAVASDDGKIFAPCGAQHLRNKSNFAWCNA
jgi:hypothetical protein